MTWSLEDHVAELFCHPNHAWREVAAMSLAQFAAAGDFMEAIGTVNFVQMKKRIPDAYMQTFEDSYRMALSRLVSQIPITREVP